MTDPVLSERDLMALVDRLLLEQGRIDPLEVLLAAGLLAYPDYEAWRLGQAIDLSLHLRVEHEAAAALLQRTATIARALRLVAEPLRHTTWGEPVQPLRVSGHLALIRACGEIYVPTKDRPQLDLFQDNRALVLEEDLVRALAERRTETALRALRNLTVLDPDHRHLPNFLHLIQIIDQAPDALTPEVRLRELVALCPLAERLLGHRARDFLCPPLGSAGCNPVRASLRPWEPWAPCRPGAGEGRGLGWGAGGGGGRSRLAESPDPGAHPRRGLSPCP